MKILVIPSCRPESLREFFRAWEGRGGWDRVIVVEDAPTRTIEGGPDVHVVAHDDIARILGPDAWIISQQDSACRCFGFLAAYWAGATHVLTLDDDVRPYPGHEDIFARHIDNLERYPVWTPTVHGLAGLRGMPRDCGRRDDVVISMGLWAGVPDLHGEWCVEYGTPTDFKPPLGRRLLATGEYSPICGMNLAAKRCALPLLYFPLQGKDWIYRRFDDIWAGVIAKEACDWHGWRISVGEPFVRHERASDPKVNAAKEVSGLVENETFWRQWDTDEGCYTGSPYVKRVYEAFKIWHRLFRERPRGL